MTSMSPRWLAGWLMDLKLGWRMLRRSPGLTVVAVVALGVAIGAGAAYLEFTRDLLRAALPAPDGDRIVGIQLWDRERGAPQRQALSDFAVWRRAASTLEFIGAARPLDRHLVTADGRVEPSRAVEITASAFRLIPTAPLVGRTLVESDERPGAAPVIVIGHDLWRSRFDGDANVAGRTVRIGSVVHTIVGVMPEGFGFPFNQNLWAPLNVPFAGLTRGEGPAVQMFGRLKPGVSAENAQAQLQGLLETGAPLRADVRPYIDMQVMDEPGNPAQGAIIHAANLVFVMLLALCGANVATLVFARTAMRHAEISVRTALGASRARIGAQLFAEALVLSSVAAVAGLAAARFGGQWITRAIAERGGLLLPFWWDDRLSPQTIVYAFVLAVFAALLVGVIPALKATSGSIMKFGRVWTGVSVTQVATTIIFLAAVASLGWTTFRGRLDYDVTFAREQYLTATLVPLDDAAGADASTLQAAYRAVADRLTSEPGVVGVTYAKDLPGAIEAEWFWLEFATPEVAAGAAFDRSGPGSGTARVGPNYFETMGIPLVAGRFFTQSEIENDRPVAVVDETFVRLILGGRSAVGLMVREPRHEAAGTAGPWHEIVGVVKDATVKARKTTADAMLYRPSSIAAASPRRMLVRMQAAAADGAPDPGGRSVRTSRSAARRRHVAGSSRRSRGARATLPAARLCRRHGGRAALVDRRHLFVDLVHAGPADAGDRHPRGAGRRPAPDRHGRPRACLRADRRRSSGGRRPCRGDHDVGPRRCGCTGNARGRGCHDDAVRVRRRRRAGLVRRAAPPRRADRSHAGAAHGLTSDGGTARLR
jgi:putative ABC transport system permease protein